MILHVDGSAFTTKR